MNHLHNKTTKEKVDKMNKKFKKMIISVLGTMLITSGCGSAVQKGEANKVTDTTKAASEITFWSTKEDTFKEICDEFTAKTGIKVNATYMGGYDDMVNKVMAGIKGKNLPDVAQLGQRHGISQMYDSGAIVAIEDLISKDIIGDILPGFWKRFTYKEKKVIVPFQNSMPVIYYNKKVLETTNTKIPTTLEEVVSSAKNIKDKAGIYGVSLNKDVSWYALGLMFSSNTKAINNGKGTMNDDKVADIFSKIQQMSITDKSMPANQHATAQEDFTNGKIGMFMGSCAGYAKIEKLVDGKFEIGVAQFPKVETMDIPMGGNGLGIFNSTPEKQKAAAQFVEFMLDKERIASNSLKSGYIPVRNAAIETETYKEYLKNPNRQVVHNQLEYLGGAGVNPADSLVWSEIESLIDSVEANPDVDIKKELKSIDEKINKYIDQYAGK